MDVAELSDVNLRTGSDLTYRPSALPQTDVSFAVPEEDSSASAGSPTTVLPPDGEKSPFGLPNDNVPLMDHADSSSDSEIDILQSVPPRRVPARYFVYSSVRQEKYYLPRCFICHTAFSPSVL